MKFVLVYYSEISFSTDNFLNAGPAHIQIRPLRFKMARNSESDNYNSNDEEVKRKRQIRLRRFPSTSKVETIVTEDEKLRRAQPDKP